MVHLNPDHRHRPVLTYKSLLASSRGGSLHRKQQFLHCARSAQSLDRRGHFNHSHPLSLASEHFTDKENRINGRVSTRHIVRPAHPLRRLKKMLNPTASA